jgi:hypothetical protein
MLWWRPLGPRFRLLGQHRSNVGRSHATAAHRRAEEHFQNCKRKLAGLPTSHSITSSEGRVSRSAHRDKWRCFYSIGTK